MSQDTLAPETEQAPGPQAGGGGSTGLWLAVLAFVLVPAIIIAGLLGYLILIARTDAAQCQPDSPAVQVNTANLSAGPVAGFGRQQLSNAAAILAAGAALGLSQRDQTIGVMTAIGESSLQVLDRGDAVGPDSRGLFQQRGNGAWGSYADRMDPTTSALNFFRVLAQVPDRDSKSPTQVAHAVQRNADPNYYTPFWGQAVAVTAALAAASAPAASAQLGGTAAPGAAGAVPAHGVAPAPEQAAQAAAALGTRDGTPGGPQKGTGGGSAACAGTAGAPATVSATGWALPAHGTLTSPFGWRVHPITGVRKFHYGQDIANTCGTPIYAAADGTVATKGFDSGGNGVIAIDNGTATIDGKATPIYTRYLHEYASGMFVSVGQVVKAGQQIGEIGSSGGSTGCHLHFEVNVGGSPVDPVGFMAARGVTLGS